MQLLPDDPVLPLGGFTSFRFVVTSSTVVNAEWLMNGTSFNSSQLHNVEQGVAAGIAILSLSNVSMDYNNTRIQCLANTSSGEVVPSKISLLRVQGT